MEYFEIGVTGLRVPRLFFGATTLGNLFKVVSDEEKASIVSGWFSCGIERVVIDSAGKYGAGLSLEVIGRELNQLEIPTERIVISNKLGWRRTNLQTAEPTFEPGAWFGLEHDAVQDISYDGILRCFEEGNQLLAGHTAQLVSVHDPDEYLAAAASAEDEQARWNDLLGAYEALMDLRQRGEVAAVGVGAKDWRTIQRLAEHCEFDWVMFANSYTIMQHPRELAQFMERLVASGTSVVNSALFHGGFLLGGDFFDYRRVDDSQPEDLKRIKWRERFLAACETRGLSPFDVGVQFGLSQPAVSAVALSSSRSERIPEHVAAITTSIPQQTWKELVAELDIRLE